MMVVESAPKYPIDVLMGWDLVNAAIAYHFHSVTPWSVVWKHLHLLLLTWCGDAYEDVSLLLGWVVKQRDCSGEEAFEVSWWSEKYFFCQGEFSRYPWLLYLGGWVGSGSLMIKTDLPTVCSLPWGMSLSASFGLKLELGLESLFFARLCTPMCNTVVWHKVGTDSSDEKFKSEVWHTAFLL